MKATNKSPRGRLADGAPNPVDVHVGARMRLRRTLLGLSQEQLGAAIGLTFQQIQKYERGANRIGASRLFDLAQVLDVPVSYFFDDMTDSVRAASPVAVITGVAPGSRTIPAETDPFARREVLDLARDFLRMPRPSRDSVRAIIRAVLANTEASTAAAAE